MKHGHDWEVRQDTQTSKTLSRIKFASKITTFVEARWIPNCVLNNSRDGASLQRKWFFRSLRYITGRIALWRFPALFFHPKWWLFITYEVLVPALPQPQCMRPWDRQHWHLIIWRLILSLPYCGLSWRSCRSKHSLKWTANKNNGALGHIRFTELRSSIWWEVSLIKMLRIFLKCAQFLVLAALKITG